MINSVVVINSINKTHLNSAFTLSTLGIHMSEKHQIEVDAFTYKTLKAWYELAQPRMHFEDMAEFLRTACRKYVDPYMARKPIPGVPAKTFNRLAVQAAERHMTVDDYTEDLLTRALTKTE